MRCTRTIGRIKGNVNEYRIALFRLNGASVGAILASILNESCARPASQILCSKRSGDGPDWRRIRCDEADRHAIQADSTGSGDSTSVHEFQRTPDGPRIFSHNGKAPLVNLPNKTAGSDFLVRWQSTSGSFMTDVDCENPLNPSNERVRTPVASLHSPTVHVEVSDLSFTVPTTISLVPYRPGFSMVVSTATPLEYGYDGAVERLSRTGQVMFFVPGREIAGAGVSGRFRTITCSFDPAYAATIVGPFDQLSEEQISAALDLGSSLIPFIMLRLMNEALYPGSLTDSVVETLGAALLVECAHCLRSEPSKLEKRGKLTARHFAIIEECLTNLAGKPPTVAQLAKACGFSERYFARLFRAQTGCSVAQYIRSFQIAKAKAYLRETDLPLKEIAFRLGFSTPGNFSSAFRSATGDTPGSLRHKKN